MEEYTCVLPPKRTIKKKIHDDFDYNLKVKKVKLESSATPLENIDVLERRRKMKSQCPKEKIESVQRISKPVSLLLKDLNIPGNDIEVSRVSNKYIFVMEKSGKNETQLQESKEHDVSESQIHQITMDTIPPKCTIKSDGKEKAKDAKKITSKSLKPDMKKLQGNELNSIKVIVNEDGTIDAEVTRESVSVVEINKNSKQTHGNVCSEIVDDLSCNVRGNVCREIVDDLSCNVCKKHFINKKALFLHKTNVHKETDHVCAVCGGKFEKLSELFEHSSQHFRHAELDSSCLEVLLKLVNTPDRYDGRSFICPFEKCSKRFAHSSNRIKHLKTVHMNIRNFVCDKCPKLFKTSNALSVHMYALHTKIDEKKKFCCPVCSKVFYTKVKLKYHETVHSDKKMYKCSYERCGRMFRLNSNRLKHEKVHADIKPYSCDLCSQRFTRKVYLDTHQYKHTGVKQFKCEICLKTFSQKGNLKIHMSTHCKEREIFGCSTCGVEFNYLSNFKRHSLKHTDSDSQREIPGAPLQCDNIIARAFNAADSSERLQIKVLDKAIETKIDKADVTDLDKSGDTIYKTDETDIEKAAETDIDKAAETRIDKADVIYLDKSYDTVYKRDETDIDRSDETDIGKSDEKAGVASVDKTAETKIDKIAENKAIIQLAKDFEKISRNGQGSKLTIFNDGRAVSELPLKPMTQENYIDLNPKTMCNTKSNRITYTQTNPAFSIVCVSAARRSQPYYLMVPVCVQRPRNKQQTHTVGKPTGIQNRIISEKDLLTCKLVDALSTSTDVITSVNTPVTVPDVALSITSPTLESNIISTLHVPLTGDCRKQVEPTKEIGQNIPVGINRQNENLYQQVAEEASDLVNIMNSNLEVHQCVGIETLSCTSPKLHTMADIQNAIKTNDTFENSFVEGVMSDDQLKHADNGQCFGMKSLDTADFTDLYSIEENGKHFKHSLLHGTDFSESGTSAESGNSYKHVILYFEELHKIWDDDEVNESIKLAEALASLENLSHEVTPKSSVIPFIYVDNNSTDEGNDSVGVQELSVDRDEIDKITEEILENASANM